MNWRFDPIIIAVAVALGAAVLVGAWWLWWQLPRRQMRSITAADPKARADIEDNFRKTIGQLIGGAAVLIGAGLAYLQFAQQQQTAHKQFSDQQEAAQKQFSEQQRASRELLISNQVSKGFEQLGSDKLVVRLGGIYALEGVMNASEQYHQPVLEALCAFVRDGTKADTGGGPPATDIQAALTVIGRRAEGQGRPDLSGVHIPKAVLIGANLSDMFLDHAVLTGAWLGVADLSFTALNDTNLSGADLSDANLTGAPVNGANLSGVNLSGAKLTGADLTSSIITQEQLDQACGTDVKLDPGLKIKPCQD